MYVNTQQIGPQGKIVLEGNINAEAAAQMDRAVRFLLPTCTQIVFDFLHVDYLSSAALRVLLAAYKGLTEKGGTVCILRVNEAVRQVLEMTGYADFFIMTYQYNEESPKQTSNGDDFNLIKLLSQNPSLLQTYQDGILCVQKMLLNYLVHFPDFTDHSSLHSMDVITFCRQLISKQISILNEDEAFILLMAAYFHDSGMGIKEEDYTQFVSELPVVQQYIATHPEDTMPKIIRRFHNEFSGKIVTKFQDLFEFPTPEHTHCIIQLVRGHRKVDLLDDNEYPAEYILPNGNIVHLAYLTALIRLADELDIASNRNLELLYFKNEHDTINFMAHKAIREVHVLPDHFLVSIVTQDAQVLEEVKNVIQKAQETLDYCIKVTEEKSPFMIYQRTIQLEVSPS